MMWTGQVQDYPLLSHILFSEAATEMSHHGQLMRLSAEQRRNALGVVGALPSRNPKSLPARAKGSEW